MTINLDLDLEAIGPNEGPILSYRQLGAGSHPDPFAGWGRGLGDGVE